MKKTLTSACKTTSSPSTTYTPVLTAYPSVNSLSLEPSHDAASNFTAATTEQETKPNSAILTEPQPQTAVTEQTQFSFPTNSPSFTPEINSSYVREEVESASTASSKPQQDRSNDNGNDDAWGVPVQKLTKEQIEHLNNQAYTENSAMPLRILSLAFLVVGGAIFVGLIKTWGLDPSVDKDLMLLTRYSGMIADYFGVNASGVAVNYAYSAIMGCLCYVIPYGITYILTFYRPMMNIFKKDFFMGYKEFSMAFLLNSLRFEFYKLALTFVMLGLCFKYGSMSKEVMICSFIALIVLVMFSGLLQALLANKTADLF